MGRTELSDGSQEQLFAAVGAASPGDTVVVKPSGLDVSAVRARMTLSGLVDIRETKEGVEGRIPSYGKGAKVSLRLSALRNAGDGALVDEHELLERDGLAVPKSCSDVPMAQRKPCKDCTCGLAEKVMDDNGVVDTQLAEKSECGNCSLGDAFRCAGCPYLGLPPFKPGEKVTVSNSLMTSDI